MQQTVTSTVSDETGIPARGELMIEGTTLVLS